MRRIAIASILCLTMGLFITSCQGSKKEGAEAQSESEMHEEHKGHDMEATTHEHSGDMATAVYQCPMKCEGEKTYSEAGNCPECKMKLAEVKPAEAEAEEGSED